MKADTSATDPSGASETVCGGFGAGMTNHYVPFPQSQPCPSCGRCPNCGRGGTYPAWPYNPYYPWWDRPWWNQVFCSDATATAPAMTSTWTVTTSPNLTLGDVKGASLGISPTANAYLN